MNNCCQGRYFCKKTLEKRKQLSLENTKLINDPRVVYDPIHRLNPTNYDKCYCDKCSNVRDTNRRTNGINAYFTL